MGIAWHLKSGPDLDTYLGYSNRRRALVRQAVQQRIKQHNDDVEAPPEG